MGRKKIEIKFIENKKERAVSFCKRKIGLMKKAAELSILCGINVNLVFTDLNNTIHHFSNNDAILFKISKSLKEELGGNSNYVKYGKRDYPFNKISDKKVVKFDFEEFENEFDMLGKREFPEVETPSYDFGSMKKVKIGVQKEKYQIPGYLKIPKTNSDKKKISLGKEQIEKIENFEKMIEVLISNKNNTDDDIITLLTLKHLVTKYFSTDFAVAKSMKKISSEDIFLMLNSIKFKDKNIDMILAYITIINDIWLELIINPNSFKTTSFHFGSLMSKGGKAITNIFSFVIRNQCHQISLLKTQFCSSFKSQIEFSKDSKLKISIMDKVINTTIHLLCQQNLLLPFQDNDNIPPHQKSSGVEEFNLEGQQAGKLSKENLNMIALGYKLHSLSLKNEEEAKETLSSALDNPYQGIGKKLMESMGRELLAKGLKGEEPQMSIETPYADFGHKNNLANFSFEINKAFANSLLSQNSIGGLKEDSDEKKTQGNLNNYVSNLLKKGK